MGTQQSRKIGSGIIVRTVTAVVFVCFTFLWLYAFAGDAIAVAQHVLSDGQTHYDPLVGAALLTLLLWLLQLGVYSIFRLKNPLHALTYFPSMLLLAVFGKVCTVGTGHIALGHWWWIAPLLLLLWAVVAWTARVVLRYETRVPDGLLSRSMWVNMVLMALYMVFVVAVSNTQAVYNYRARTEACLLRHDVEGALAVGSRSLETDASLTMLRAYALSRRGELGERLFAYPVAGSGADLLPLPTSSSRLLRYPQDSLYRHLGAIPRPAMTTQAYLDALTRHHQATPAAADYLLCAQLVDRDLDAFVRTLPRYYEVSDSSQLPKHYREALTLYTHLRANPVVVYHHPITEEDYANLQELEAKYADPRERKVKVLESYFGSYWYYYEYMK